MVLRESIYWKTRQYSGEVALESLKRFRPSLESLNDRFVGIPENKPGQMCGYGCPTGLVGASMGCARENNSNCGGFYCC